LYEIVARVHRKAVKTTAKVTMMEKCLLAHMVVQAKGAKDIIKNSIVETSQRKKTGKSMLARGIGGEEYRPFAKTRVTTVILDKAREGQQGGVPRVATLEPRGNMGEIRKKRMQKKECKASTWRGGPGRRDVEHKKKAL